MDLKFKYAISRKNLRGLPDKTPEQLSDKLRKVEWDLDSVIGHVETAKRHLRWLEELRADLKRDQLTMKINRAYGKRNI